MEIPERKLVVTLMLAGGHQRHLQLDADDPILQSLLETVAERGTAKTRQTIFNLQLDDGESSLVFAASDLIAVSTNPPVSIDLKIENSEVAFSRVIKKNYLSKQTVAKLLKFVDRQAGKFKPSKLTTGTSKERRSLVLGDLGDFGEMFLERVRADLPEIVKQLGIPAFPVSEIECQMTTHNNAHYFHRHRDAGVQGTSSRLVTYVYYFHREPRRFEGGSIRMYHGKLENGAYSCGKVDVELEPVNNSMLFFPSACYHEVLPITCSSGKFGDGRFTVNGWVRAAE